MTRKTLWASLLVLLALLASPPAAPAQTPPAVEPYPTYAQFKTWSERQQLAFLAMLIQGIDVAFEKAGERWPQDIHDSLKDCPASSSFVHAVLVDAASDGEFDKEVARELIFRVYVSACEIAKERMKERKGGEEKKQGVGNFKRPLP